ncbi:MAG: carboxypeptidase regulatory-like domain-containing protein [Sedimentisphaerales bacterium]|nr:carboxypeptidase regulatory-like domain-containing protein [Sedimentisphaerales bacterium]
MREGDATLDVTLAPTLTLSGKVVNEQGQPIASARITPMLRMANWGWSMTRERVTTGADGTFTVLALPRDHRYGIYATADGYGRAESDIEVEQTQGEQLEIGALTLPLANLSISGQVVDLEGNPIPGVRLYGYGEGQPDRIDAQTDGEGRFVLDAVCAGEISLQADVAREGRRLTGRMVTEGGAAGVKIVVREGNAPTQYHTTKTYEQIVASSDKIIAGVAVEESGAPVAGVPLGVRFVKREREGRMSWMFGGSDNLRATTDKQGRFAIPMEEDDGEYGLLFSPNNHAATLVYDVPVNTRDLKVTLEKGGTIAGRLMRLEGTRKVPIPNAEVKLEQTSRSSYTHLGFDRDQIARTDEQGRFRFEHIQTGVRPDSSRTQAEWSPVPRVWQLVHGDTTQTFAFTDGPRIEDFELLVKPSIETTAPLVGNRLPSFEGIAVELSEGRRAGKAMLLCFFDYQQRPSRNTVMQLVRQAEALRQKGIVVAAIQAAQSGRAALDTWARDNNVPFPVGTITADIEATRAVWRVESLPWLILTDKEHIVLAEGFGLDELDEVGASNRAER